MHLRIKDGTLSLGSIYKLFAIAWFTTWITVFGIVLTVLMLIALATGEIHSGGEIVVGRVAVLIEVAPFFVMFPIIIGLQSLLFAGFLTGGIWLYRIKRPLVLVIED